jgi:hypothetical protein
LLWAARLYPGQYIEYADLAATLLGLSRRLMARRLVREVVIAAVCGARKALGQRGFHFVMTVRGVGVRCTVDKADAKENYWPRLQKWTLQCLRRELRLVEQLVPAELKALDYYETSIHQVEAHVAMVEKIMDVSQERRRLRVLRDRLTEAHRVRRAS